MKIIIKRAVLLYAIYVIFCAFVSTVINRIIDSSWVEDFLILSLIPLGTLYFAAYMISFMFTMLFFIFSLGYYLFRDECDKSYPKMFLIFLSSLALLSIPLFFIEMN